MPKKPSGLSVFTLAMLIIVSIDSIRNLPATAMFGSTLIFFFVFSALVFLLPVALISAELTSTLSHQDGGIYFWVQKAFGKKIGFIAIWLQWINTMVWYPTILSFIAGTLSFVIDPQLAQNKAYLVSVILIVFWGMTLANLRGVKTSARFASVCAVGGMILPMAFIITLACVWLFSGKPLAIHFTRHNMLPTLHHASSWISLTAIMTAFLGMELATVHVRNVNNAQKAFPKALWISVIVILITMILGSLAIAFVIPQSKIQLVDGVMQAFENFFAVYHLTWITPIATILLLMGSLGGMINWIISPAKGLLQAAQDDFLPSFLQKENRFGVAQNLLLLQAVLVSLMCLAFLLMPSVNGSYWLLTDLSTQLYMLMYVLMFAAAFALKNTLTATQSTFTVPGGKTVFRLVCLLGLIGCAITLTVGFFPPDNINVGSKAHYEWLFGGGMLVMMLPILFFYAYRAR